MTALIPTGVAYGTSRLDGGYRSCCKIRHGDLRVFHNPWGLWLEVELTKEQIPLFTGIKMSQHQVTFQEVLGLALMRGKLPEHLHLIGVQPVTLEIGTDLSPQVAALVPRMSERASRVLAAWGGRV